MAVPASWDKDNLDWPQVMRELTPALTKFIYENPNVRMAYFKDYEWRDGPTVEEVELGFTPETAILRFNFSASWTPEYSNELWRQKKDDLDE